MRNRLRVLPARTSAVAERAGGWGRPVPASKMASDGPPTERRPGTIGGPAGTAAFISGPRPLTDGCGPDGRAFLHSFEPATDPVGSPPEAVPTGPLVVSQWINSKDYIATVETALNGSGSRATRHPVGTVRSSQGNGGDLMTGLPLQSLLATGDDCYHQPRA